MVVRDGEWSLFDYNMKLKRQVWVRQNPDGSQTYRTDYEVDPTIEANKALRNTLDAGWKGDWHKIASIPLGTYYDKLAEASRQGDDAYLAKWLNDGDNAAFRTKEGRV